MFTVKTSQKTKLLQSFVENIIFASTKLETSSRQSTSGELELSRFFFLMRKKPETPRAHRPVLTQARLTGRARVEHFEPGSFRARAEIQAFTGFRAFWGSWTFSGLSGRLNFLGKSRAGSGRVGPKKVQHFGQWRI
jgi:hypothetical protein